MVLAHAVRPDWSTATDIDLIDAIRDRDQAAFGELHRRTSGQLLAYVQVRLLDRAQSEEVVQEVFLEVWQQAARYDSRLARVTTWMHRIAHARAVDRIRSAQRTADREMRIGVRDHQTLDHGMTDAVDTLDGRTALDSALSRLSPRQREAVVLRYLRELDNTETAHHLGINVNTAKTRVRDGLTALRELLTPADAAYIG